MGRRAEGDIPAYKLHKASGRAYCQVDRKQHYFGTFGTRESRADYRAFVERWERVKGKLQAEVDDGEPGTILEAVQVYLDEALGEISATERADIERNLTTLTDRYGDCYVDDFKPLQLRDLRDHWCAAGHVRKTINKAMGRIRQFFQWCVREEFAQPDTHSRLLAEPNLKRGKKAPDNPPVEAVPESDYLATLPQLSSRLRAMAQIQFLCGSRPAEVCAIRGREIHQAGSVRIGRSSIQVPAGVWLWMPPHKTQRLEKLVVYTMGPQAQAIVAPWLRDNPDEHLFQPREQRVEQYAALRTDESPAAVQRREKRKQRRPGTRYARSAWTTDSYDKSIAAAAKRAKVPHWSPNQLRHSFVSRTTALSNLLTASAAVSHSSPDVTLMYLDRQIQEVAKLAAKHG